MVRMDPTPCVEMPNKVSNLEEVTLSIDMGFSVNFICSASFHKWSHSCAVPVFAQVIREKHNQRSHPNEWTLHKKYIFICLKYHKGNIRVWIVIIFFGIFSINCKVYILKVWHKSKMFLHVKTFKPWKCTVFF
jgi:hypothetical protein